MKFDCLALSVARALSASLVVALSLSSPAQAQSSGCQPGWVDTFGRLPGTDGWIQASAVFDDGSGPALYVGGEFDEFDGIPTLRVAKWDGARAAALGAGVDAGVLALATFDDGSGSALLAGGFFRHAGGTSAVGLAKWNGTSWTAFGGASALGQGSQVYSLCVFDDGSGPALYAGGNLSLPGGIACGSARWRAGSWTPLGAAITGWVRAWTVHDDGSGVALYAVGHFESAPGFSAGIVAKWTGSDWSMVGTPTVYGQEVYSICSCDLGGGAELYIGADFLYYYGTTQWSAPAAKWDGSTWSPVDVPMVGYGSVMALRGFDGGSGMELYAGGTFDNYFSGIPDGQSLVKWDGANWTEVGGGIAGWIFALDTFDLGHGPELFAGGRLYKTADLAIRGAAHWDGSHWESLGEHSRGPDLDVDALAVFDDGSGIALYAGGVFSRVGDRAVTGIARWDGAHWSAPGGGLAQGSFVSALAAFDDGSGSALYAAGYTDAIGGIPATGIAKWNGTNWSAPGGGIPGLLLSATVHDDGSGPALFVSGGFTSAGGVPAHAIAKWNGSTWSALGGGIGTPGFGANALLDYDDGSGHALYVGGPFTNVGGISVAGIARWHAGQWSALGSGVTDSTGAPAAVYALAVFDDGTGPGLYAGGNFEFAGGSPAAHLARWSGSAWLAVGGGLDATVRSLCVFDDGNGPALYAGGQFTHAGGLAARHLARWDGTGWSALGSGTEIVAAALCVFADGSCAGPALYVGGSSESMLGGKFLDRWGCEPQCTSGCCFGDGSSTSQLACPCANTGVAGHGCENSAATGGAQLVANGQAFNDTLSLTSSGELASSLSIFLQGNAHIPNGVVFGDGVRCVAGALKRMYSKSAVGGVASAPTAGDLSIRAQSANLGDPIAPGTWRWYQVHYRDPSTSFCPTPQGGSFNVSNGIEVRW